MNLDWQTILTAASLGVALLFGYLRIRDKRPQIRVTAKEDLLVTSKMQGTFPLETGIKRSETGKPTTGIGKPIVRLELANLGDKAARVAEVRIVQPSGAFMRLESMGAERPFPPTIEPGDSTNCWICLGKITDIVGLKGKGKVPMTFKVTDALGNVYEDKMRIDTAEWAPYSHIYSGSVG